MKKIEKKWKKMSKTRRRNYTKIIFKKNNKKWLDNYF